ncbi:MAG TPA: 50S ribosomal protein L4 [Thermoanaerobaculia bacterium]|nr:50S ribosomal protein L4 [Thermoanaerobaculia bacterium]
MKIAVKSLNNKKVKDLDLPDEIFAYPYKEHLIYLAVEAYRAGQRTGSHKAKGRGDVAGSGRKLWRQKGTGRARVGSVRSPLWRGGGVVHGPRPRSHEKDLSAREKRNALKSALARKLVEERLMVVDTLDLETHKTTALIKALGGLGVEGKTLLVDRWDNEKLSLAARNNPAVKTVDALAVNVFDVVDRPYLVVSESALSRLVEVLSK